MSDALIAAGINSATQSINNAANFVSTNKMNRKTREWNERMYQQQKNDSIEMWKMQNEYNDPSQQMARLKLAGLNPNLVYGKGADNTAGSISTPTSPKWNPETPKLDLNATEVLNQMYTIPNLQAQEENLRKNNELLEAQKLKTAAETANLGIKGSSDALSLELAQSLFDTTIEKQKADLDKTRTETTSIFDENTRRNALQQPTLKQAALSLIKTDKEISKMGMDMGKVSKEIENLIQQNRILTKQAEMWENNQNPNDPTWMRLAFAAIQEIYESFKKPTTQPRKLTPGQLSDKGTVIDRYKYLRENQWRWKKD